MEERVNQPQREEAAAVLDERLERRRFRRFAAAGMTFQGGSAAVDSSTIMAALVHQLTGSAVAVGAVTAILRIGWLAPQLIVGHLAQRRRSRMPFYVVGAFGRATCLALLAAYLAFADRLPPSTIAVGFFMGWIAYAFVSGIVAVPYNDIVARSITSEHRSRLLATRFFGGGVLALLIAATADRLVAVIAFPGSYAAIVAVAAGLMYMSSILFVSAGEPSDSPPSPSPTSTTFARYLREGKATFHSDWRFRRFVFAQWCGAGVMMALPFFVVEATILGLDLGRVALLLGAQTAGALVSNPLWGWWGDRRGKGNLLRNVALMRIVPPIATLLLAAVAPISQATLLIAFAGIFFLVGALMNGATIAVIGFLMEISPDDRRPAYGGYFNALTAPAYLLPIAGGFLAEATGMGIVFIVATGAAIAQFALLRGVSATVASHQAASRDASPMRGVR